MSKIEATIDCKNFMSDESNLDDLKQALAKLTNASEKQFEEIKKEKWFNRLFDMVTFSQKGKKRVAEQISSVAQAQQILMEISLRLSSYDEKIAKIVFENRESIKKLQENEIYTLRQVKQLENNYLGIKRTADISELSKREKETLSGCLYALQKQYVDTSELQKKYANTVCRYINVETEITNLTEVLAQTEEVSRKRILACCMEYIFLNQCKANIPDFLEDFIDLFDFGQRTIKDIIEHIKRTYELRGADGIIDKYYSEDSEDDLEDTFYFEVDEDEDFEENMATGPREMSDVFITNILQINAGETKLFSYNNIHISSYINCQGSLIFDNCVINYNESEDSDEITLGEDANLEFNNCFVQCHGFDETPFISSDGNSNAVNFTKSIFKDCTYFFKSKKLKNFTMKECQIKDCYIGFVNAGIQDGGVCEITSCSIENENITRFNDKKEKDGNTLFSISYDKKNSNCRSKISENIVRESQTLREHLKQEKYELRFFSVVGDVKNCTFQGATDCITGVISVEKCIFNDCVRPINNDVIFDYNIGDWLVSECVFNDCTQVIIAGSNSKVSNCQFNKCFEDIIDGHRAYDGGVTIEFCEFNNLVQKPNTNKYEFAPRALITLRRSDENKSSSNYIRKCVFNGVIANNGFLIKATYFGKRPPKDIIIVEDCTFKNCTTKRPSGVIIKTKVQYDTLLQKNLDFEAVTINRCKGLDKINKEGDKAQDVEIKKEATTGAVIGALACAATAIGLGPIGIVAGLAAGAATTAGAATVAGVLNGVFGRENDRSEEAGYGTVEKKAKEPLKSSSDTQITRAKWLLIKRDLRYQMTEKEYFSGIDKLEFKSQVGNKVEIIAPTIEAINHVNDLYDFLIKKNIRDRIGKDFELIYSVDKFDYSGIIKKNWSEIKQYIREEIWEGEYSSYIRNLEIESENESSVIILAPTEDTAQYVKENFEDNLKRAIHEKTGKTVTIHYEWEAW